MAEPIEIIIRQGGQGGLGLGSGTGGAVSGSKGTSRGSTTGLIGNQKNPLLEKIDAVDSQILDSVKSSIKQTIMYGINNYGNMTGNYQAQEQINLALKVAGDLASIGIATAKYGPPGLVVMGFTKATEFGMQYNNLLMNLNKQSTQASYMREIAGSSLNSGSRGTYE